MIPNILRPFLSQIIASVVISAGAWLGSKIGTDPMISPDTAMHVAEGALTWLTLTITHRAVSVKTNPTNSAAPSLAGTKPAEVIPKSETPSGVTNNI